MAISLVNVDVTSNVANTTAFTITKPTNTATGDVMVSVVVDGRTAGSDSTFACAGWTKLRDVFASNTSANDQANLAVFTRTCQAGDGASWAGTKASGPYKSITWAFSGASETLIAENTAINEASAQTNYTSATVANTDAGAWVLGAIICVEAGTTTFTAAGYTERHDATMNVTGTHEMNVAAYDSNGSVSVGDKSIPFVVGTAQDVGANWIGVIGPTSGGATSAPAGLVSASTSVDGSAGIVGFTVGTASSTATADDATVTTSGDASPDAGLTSVTSTAEGPITSLGVRTQVIG